MGETVKYIITVLLLFFAGCRPYLNVNSTGSLFVKASEGCFRGPFNISTKTLGSKWGEKLDIEFFVKNAGSYRVSVLLDGKLVRTWEFGKKALVNECPSHNEDEESSSSDSKSNKDTPPLKRTEAHFVTAWNDFHKVTQRDKKANFRVEFTRYNFTLIDHRITDSEAVALKEDIPIKVIIWSPENTLFRDFYAHISQYEYVPNNENEYKQHIQKMKK